MSQKVLMFEDGTFIRILGSDTPIYGEVSGYSDHTFLVYMDLNGVVHKAFDEKKDMDGNTWRISDDGSYTVIEPGQASAFINSGRLSGFGSYKVLCWGGEQNTTEGVIVLTTATPSLYSSSTRYNSPEFYDSVTPGLVLNSFEDSVAQRPDIGKINFLPSNNSIAVWYSSTTGFVATTFRSFSSWRDYFSKSIVDSPKEETDPYADYGSDDLGGELIPVPDLPTVSGLSTGIFSLYAPTENQMNQLANFLWSNIYFDDSFSYSTVEQILNAMGNVFQGLGEALKRLVADPLKLVLGLSIIPSQGLAVGSAQNVRVGFWDTGVAMNVLSNQYFTVDCGSLDFNTVCGDTFLDYAPYSKFSIYLPYCGTKQLDANDCVGHRIGVVYHGDCVTGSVTCYVTKDDSVMYQFSGSCALHLPLSSQSYASVISSAINLAGQIGAAYASSGSAGITSAAINGAANVAANPSMLSPSISHSGAVAGGAGLLGVQKPYIIREAVRFPSTAGFNKITGYPAHIKRQLGDIEGYTVVYDLHLENVPATSTERDEIENLLKGGVIL